MSLDLEPINRIIEIDFNEAKDNTLTVRQLEYSELREDGDLGNTDSDLGADLTVITAGLLAMILHAESTDAYNKGEAMTSVMKTLEEGYINPNLKTKSNKKTKD